MNDFHASWLVHFDAPFHWSQPGTWPWIFYVWLVFLLIGWIKPFWSWLQREQAKSWPTATGRIDSASLGEPKRFLGLTLQPDRSRTQFAVLAYSYNLSGAAYHGEYRRNFASGQDANEFLRGLAGQSVSVQYHPDKPSRSLLLESSVEALLRNRPPAPDSAASSLAIASLSDWQKPFVAFFAFLSLVGLILSLWVHIGALFGHRVAPEYFFWGLHMGIFVVFIPAVFLGRKSTAGSSNKDYWKIVTKGSPGLRYLLYFFFAYAFVNFAIFFAQAPTGKQIEPTPAIVWRGFSGHWMLFYCAAFVILSSALRSSRQDP